MIRINKNKCKNCEHLKVCTNSKDKTKVIFRHIWEEYIEKCEDIRHRSDYKEIYSRRKETIERVFGTAKEYHSMRYTRTIGKQKIELQVGFTFACLNLMKLAKIMDKKGWGDSRYIYYILKYYLLYLFDEYFSTIHNKGHIEFFQYTFCLQSDISIKIYMYFIDIFCLLFYNQTVIIIIYTKKGKNHNEKLYYISIWWPYISNKYFCN